MNAPIHRRAFLKLLSLLPLTPMLSSEDHLAAGTAPPRSDEGKPNVLIFVFDALSARHLSIHGYPRNTTPNLAKFAERATVYHAHRSAGNFTPPGTASLLAGTYPWTHRAIHNVGVVAKGQEDHNLFRAFGDGYQRIAFPQNPLAGLLTHQFSRDIDTRLNPGKWSLFGSGFSEGLFARDADLAFRAIDDHLFQQRPFPGSPFLASADMLRIYAYEEFGLGEYADLYPRGLPFQAFYPTFFVPEHVTEGIMSLLSNLRQPYVAYFHLWPPHDPYRPRREFIGLFDDGWAPVEKEIHELSHGFDQEFLNRQRVEYDEYVAHVDAEFGRLVRFLDETGILETSYVVFTSDHGELFERGHLGHVTELLYEPIIHIPLLIGRPGQRQREDVFVSTSSVDVLPTLLDAIGQPIPDWCEGKVLPSTTDQDRFVNRSTFALDAKSSPKHGPLTTRTAAIVKGQYKLIHYSGYEGYENEYELYDLTNDPEEMENLYPMMGSIAADLWHELQEKLREVNEPYTQ